MPPELEVVAFRVLQEMLTNAIKHGRRDQPVRVERHWEGDLRIEVQNAVDSSGTETQPMRRRTGAAEQPVRDSTGCGAGSRRSAAGSTYAAATDPPDLHRDGLGTRSECP